MSHLLPGGPTRRGLRGTDGTSATDQIPLGSCKDRNQSDRRKAMSNAHEIQARSRRSAVAPRYIRPSHVCKSSSAASSSDPSATTSAQSLLQVVCTASRKALQASPRALHLPAMKLPKSIDARHAQKLPNCNQNDDQQLTTATQKSAQSTKSISHI